MWFLGGLRIDVAGLFQNDLKTIFNEIRQHTYIADWHFLAHTHTHTHTHFLFVPLPVALLRKRVGKN